MDPFTNLVTELVVAASGPNSSPDETQREVVKVLRASKGVGPELLNGALRRLGDVIATASVPQAALVSILCGAIVEAGGAPDAASEGIITSLPEVLEHALAFARACESAAGADPDYSDDDERESPGTPLGKLDLGRFINTYGERVSASDPQGANCWMATEQMGMGAIAMLSRSPRVRELARETPTLHQFAAALAAFHVRAKFLWEMLQVLDDEQLLVLHVEQGRGYRVKIRGIADNFQLHVLLADTLIGDATRGLIAGKRPDPRIAAAARNGPVAPGTHVEGAFNLVNWTGLQPDGTLPVGHCQHSHWIWNEGVPADILPFEGIRVVLLSKPPYERGWNPGRRFSGMIGEMRLVETMEPDEVQRWIDRIAAAPRPRAGP